MESINFIVHVVSCVDGSTDRLKREGTCSSSSLALTEAYLA